MISAYSVREIQSFWGFLLRQNDDKNIRRSQIDDRQVENSNLHFLGNLQLNLWDCGGQDVFMENYFESQRDHIFRSRFPRFFFGA